ncbi:MAG TPA: hypothetical protein VIW78_02695 [Burkholderiales bacterium]
MDSPQIVLLALVAFFFVLWVPIVLWFFEKRTRDRQERGAGAGILHSGTDRGRNC